MPDELARYAALDQRLLAAVRPIRILPTVAWSASLEDRMIADYAAGRLALPEVRYMPPDLSAARAELAAGHEFAHRVCNDRLDEAADALEAIVRAELAAA